MVKLYIDQKLDTSGKGKFLSRICPYLEQYGISLVSYKEAHVVLGVNRYRKGVLEGEKRKIKDGKKRVLRIDGVHCVKTKRNVWANKRIAQDIKRSDAVIWQSAFGRRMGGGILGAGKNSYVIWNGANTDPKIETIELTSPKNVILAAKWYSDGMRELKRLDSMVAFAEQYHTLHPDVMFHVFGDAGDRVRENKGVLWYGSVGEITLRSYMAKCDCMLYLAYGDCCPNSVVECLCSGTPVICGNQGGPSEFCPCVLSIDAEIPAKLVSEGGPPPVEFGPVKEAMDVVLYGAFNWELHPDLKIENVAKKYAQVIRSIA